MSNNKNRAPTVDSTYYTDAPTPLHAAVQLADLIRKHIDTETDVHDAVNEHAFTVDIQGPPGLLDGLIAGGLVGVALLPVRSVLLRTAGKSMGQLPDLIASSSMAVAAATTGLFVGSLQGSRVYLQQLAQVPPQRSSPTADRICADGMTQRFRQDYLSPETRASFQYTNIDPRKATLQTFWAALDSCRRRSEYQLGERTMTSWWRPPSR